MEESISEALYIYDALQKRKPFLDQLMDGLEELQVANAMRLFPDVFEPSFVSGNNFEPQAVINILRPKVPMTRVQPRRYNMHVRSSCWDRVCVSTYV